MKVQKCLMMLPLMLKLDVISATTCSIDDCSTTSSVSAGGQTQSVNGHSDLQGNVVGSASIANVGGSATSEASANYGVLKAQGTASAASGLSQVGQFISIANFSDKITVTSSTLAIDTPVQLEAKIWVDGSITLNKGSFNDPFGTGLLAPTINGSYSLSLTGSPLSGNFPDGISALSSQSLSFGGVNSVSMTKNYDIGNTLASNIVNGFVGETFSISGALSVLINAINGTNGSANFYNTAHFSIASINNQDIKVVGDSGYEYSNLPANVPLPGGLILFISGLLGLTGIKSIRRN